MLTSITTTPFRYLLNGCSPTNIHNVHDMISVFPNMEAEVEELDPQAYDVKEIGHMKFFSRKCQHLWPKVTNYFNQYV